MKRTNSELASYGNPFRRVVKYAQAMIRDRDPTVARRYELNTTAGIAAIGSEALSLYGILLADSVPSDRAPAVVRTVASWISPPGEIVSGQVSRIDVSRRQLHAGQPKSTRTTVTLQSSAESGAAHHRVGIRIGVDASPGGLAEARIDLVETQGLPDGSSWATVHGGVVYDSDALRAVDATKAGELPASKMAGAILPLVSSCSEAMGAAYGTIPGMTTTYIPVTGHEV